MKNGYPAIGWVNFQLALVGQFYIGGNTFNYFMNPFGLLGKVDGEYFRVYLDEKTSKYLFSFNYIPSNFDGILVGSSVSNKLMATEMLKNYQIYNLSMDGENVTEVKYAVDNVLERGDIKVAIICLDPYFTKNSGTKSSQINPNEYWSTLGSVFMLRYYLHRVFDFGEDEFSDSYWGYTRYDKIKLLRSGSSTLQIDSLLSEFESGHESAFQNLNLDEVAFRELGELIESIRDRNVKIIAYYFPRPKRLFNHPSYASRYALYRRKIDSLLDYSADTVIDFSTEYYDFIRDDDSSYVDTGHLSANSAAKVLRVLNENL